MDEIYFHPRDKNGSLKEPVNFSEPTAQPATPKSYEEEQLALDQMWSQCSGVFRWPPSEYDRLKHELAVKYGKI